MVCPLLGSEVVQPNIDRRTKLADVKRKIIIIISVWRESRTRKSATVSVKDTVISVLAGTNVNVLGSIEECVAGV